MKDNELTWKQDLKIRSEAQEELRAYQDAELRRRAMIAFRDSLTFDELFFCDLFVNNDREKIADNRRRGRLTNEMYDSMRRKFQAANEICFNPLYAA